MKVIPSHSYFFDPTMVSDAVGFDRIIALKSCIGSRDSNMRYHWSKNSSKSDPETDQSMSSANFLQIN